MDIGYYLRESAAFTKATLWDRPSRWLVFIVLGLPWSILLALAESSRIVEGMTVHWSLVPWREAGLLILAGAVCNLLVVGWIVRLLRNDPEPPGFDRPHLLLLDGIKASTIPLVWMVVPSALAFAGYLITGGGSATIDLLHPEPVEIVLLVLIALQALILFIAVQYVLIGTIRYARTGSVREGLAVLEIKKTLDRIGIINYFVALAVVILSWLLFSLVTREAAFLPVAGPVLSLALSPVPTVFCFRFMAHFCDEDRLPGSSAGAGGPVALKRPGLSARALVAEYAAWLPILAILVVLCFTPMVLIAERFWQVLP